MRGAQPRGSVIHETKGGVAAALRCPRCTWWTASTDMRRAEERRGHLYGQLVTHLVRAHGIEQSDAQREAERAESN